MSDAFPEQKQHQYNHEYPDAARDDAYSQDRVGVYDQPEGVGLTPTILAVAAIIALIVLVAMALLLLI